MVDGLGSGGFTEPRSEEPIPGGPRGQLYNLETDPYERENIWLDQCDVVMDMLEVLETVRKEGRSRPA